MRRGAGTVREGGGERREGKEMMVKTPHKATSGTERRGELLGRKSKSVVPDEACASPPGHAVFEANCEKQQRT